MLLPVGKPILVPVTPSVDADVAWVALPAVHFQHALALYPITGFCLRDPALPGGRKGGTRLQPRDDPSVGAEAAGLGIALTVLQ